MRLLIPVLRVTEKLTGNMYPTTALEYGLVEAQRSTRAKRTK